jgi:hypothetical protein
VNERGHIAVVGISQPTDEVALLALDVRHPSPDGVEVALHRVGAPQPLQFNGDHLGSGQHGFDSGPDGGVEDVASDRERRTPIAVLI